MTESILVSIAIPVYEMKGHGIEFLSHSFEKIKSQSYKKIQVVISDHSIENQIQNLCIKWGYCLNIKYIKNEKFRGSSSSNLNNAIDNCDGEIIKILFQDDYLHNKDSIRSIVNNFTEHAYWLVTACDHTPDGHCLNNKFYPYWNDKIYLGVNTISSPSVLSIRNTVTERFDQNLIWMMDCDYYMKLYKKYGEPKILNEVNVVNRIWGSRLSDTIPTIVKYNERTLMLKRYNKSKYFLELIIKKIKFLYKFKFKI